MLNSGANIHSCQLTQSKIFIKGVMENVQETIPPPDHSPHATPVVVSPGIVISNSETGEASLTIQPAVHFLRCTNLATWAQHSLRRRHIGQIQGDLDQDIQQFLSDRTKTLSDAALWSRVSDLTQAALNGDIFQTIVAELRAAREVPITPGTVTATVEKLAETRSLPDNERSGILEYLMQGGEFTKFALSNAITRFSQDTEDYDRATYLEELGGEIIALPATTGRPSPRDPHPAPGDTFMTPPNGRLVHANGPVTVNRSTWDRVLQAHALMRQTFHPHIPQDSLDCTLLLEAQASSAIEQVDDPTAVALHRAGLADFLLQPFSRESLLQLHQTVMLGQPHAQPGRYRTVQVVVGDYSPPPPHEVPALMTEFFDFFSHPPTIPPTPSSSPHGPTSASRTSIPSPTATAAPDGPSPTTFSSPHPPQLLHPPPPVRLLPPSLNRRLAPIPRLVRRRNTLHLQPSRLHHAS